MLRTWTDNFVIILRFRFRGIYDTLVAFVVDFVTGGVVIMNGFLGWQHILWKIFNEMGVLMLKYSFDSVIRLSVWDACSIVLPH